MGRADDESLNPPKSPVCLIVDSFEMDKIIKYSKRRMQMNKKLFNGLSAIVALVAASLACSLPGGGPIIQDDFEGSDSNWGLLTDSESSIEYLDGGLRMALFGENYVLSSTPNEESYENVHIEVTVKNNVTDSATSFGIICDQQQPITDSHYYFAVIPDGSYAIAKASLALDDVFLTNDDDWGYSDSIAQNADSYRLGADCGNGKLTLYVDGQEIASVSDSTYTSGSVGLFLWTGAGVTSADITFDDFVVTKLESQ